MISSTVSLFNDAPVVRLSWPIHLPKYWCITRILKGGIEIDFDEVEEDFQVRIPPVLCLLHASFVILFRKERTSSELIPSIW